MTAEEILHYTPKCEQERRDREIMLRFMAENDDAFLRENEIAHFTASSWIVSEDFKKTLMVYHNIFNSWSWTGGHADGERDLLAVALREAKEETGVEHIRPHSGEIISLETITVDGHEKRGRYVPSHLHLNVTYLLIADENDALRVKADENKGVSWFGLDEALEKCTEPWMTERVYKKLNKLVREIKERV